MSTVALTTVSLLYLMTAYDYAEAGNIGMALAFLAYAVANVGFIIAR